MYVCLAEGKKNRVVAIAIAWLSLGGDIIASLGRMRRLSLVISLSTSQFADRFPSYTVTVPESLDYILSFWQTLAKYSELAVFPSFRRKTSVYAVAGSGKISIAVT